MTSNLNFKEIKILPGGSIEAEAHYWINREREVQEEQCLPLYGKPVNRVTVPVIDKTTGAIKHLRVTSDAYTIIVKSLKLILMIHAQQQKATAFKRRRRSINARNRHGV